jgi:3',5'-cyclic AMP phosphodiesterase CpdA
MGSPVARTRALVLLFVLACAALTLSAACRNEAAIVAPPVRVLTPAPGALALPLQDGSVRFAVIGDSGRGDRPQHDVARQMVNWRARFPFDFVLMLGDNIYDSHTAADYVAKFEEPYKPLLDAGVTFHAAIGNHDDPGQIFYNAFNMGGERYYTFRKSERRLQGLAGAGVRFFVLDSRTLDPPQLAWLRDALAESGTAWKIAYFHHPIYTSGRYESGARALRLALEPVLVTGGIDVVLSGHEHFYERMHPQRGITYFTSGAAGSLRRGDIRRTPLTAIGFDTDYHFMLMEVTGDELYFQAISRTGETIDAGVITRAHK